MGTELVGQVLERRAGVDDRHARLGGDLFDRPPAQLEGRRLVGELYVLQVEQGPGDGVLGDDRRPAVRRGGLAGGEVAHGLVEGLDGRPSGPAEGAVGGERAGETPGGPFQGARRDRLDPHRAFGVGRHLTQDLAPQV